MMIMVIMMMRMILIMELIAEKIIFTHIMLKGKIEPNMMFLYFSDLGKVKESERERERKRLWVREI